VNKELNSQILLDLHNFLNQNGIDHFLFFGTLLGAYRNNDYLSADIDIVVDYKDYWKFRNLIDHNVEGWSYNCIWRKEIALWKYGRKIDILFYDKGIEDTSFYIYKKNNVTGRWHTEQRYVFKTKHLFPLRYIDCLDSQFLIPKCPEEVFDCYYGKDWKTPNPNWNRDVCPAPCLDKEYRHIRVHIKEHNDKIVSYFLDNYDKDWIRVYKGDCMEMITDPYTLEIGKDFDTSKLYNLQVLLEILNAEPDIGCVGYGIERVPNCITPTSRANEKGFHYSTIRIEHDKFKFYMFKNTFSSKSFLTATTNDKNIIRKNI